MRNLLYAQQVKPCRKIGDSILRSDLCAESYHRSDPQTDFCDSPKPYRHAPPIPHPPLGAPRPFLPKPEIENKSLLLSPIPQDVVWCGAKRISLTTPYRHLGCVSFSSRNRSAVNSVHVPRITITRRGSTIGFSFLTSNTKAKCPSLTSETRRLVTFKFLLDG